MYLPDIWSDRYTYHTYIIMSLLCDVCIQPRKVKKVRTYICCCSQPAPCAICACMHTYMCTRSLTYIQILEAGPIPAPFITYKHTDIHTYIHRPKKPLRSRYVRTYVCMYVIYLSFRTHRQRRIVLLGPSSPIPPLRKRGTGPQPRVLDRPEILDLFPGF